MQSSSCNRRDIAIKIGVAIARQDPDILQELDLNESRLTELKAIWRRIELAFSPEERYWFKQALKGHIIKQSPSISLIGLNPTDRLIRLSDLTGLPIEIEGEVVRQSDGTLAIGQRALTHYLTEQRRQAIYATFSVACR